MGRDRFSPGRPIESNRASLPAAAIRSGNAYGGLLRCSLGRMRLGEAASCLANDVPGPLTPTHTQTPPARGTAHRGLSPDSASVGVSPSGSGKERGSKVVWTRTSQFSLELATFPSNQPRGIVVCPPVGSGARGSSRSQRPARVHEVRERAGHLIRKARSRSPARWAPRWASCRPRLECLPHPDSGGRKTGAVGLDRRTRRKANPPHACAMGVTAAPIFSLPF